MVTCEPPPIAGSCRTTKLHRLKENLGAAEVSLTAADPKEISAALAGIRVEGERYPAHLQAMAGR
jgi:aryl-alcohol dehydrogenase-like predicted oxidoreductase